ncbi:MAG: pitrilysin family protein [Mariprofundaceae bacterium]
MKYPFQMLKAAVLIFVSLALIPTAHAVPSIQQKTLDNGLQILLIEAHNVPMVSMNLVLPSGSRFDPSKKGGTASFLADMLTDHTAKHDHTTWAEKLDAEAIQLGASVDRDGFNLSLTVLNEALESGLTAFSEALLQPGWNKKRFANLKEDALAAAKKELEEPGIQAANASARLLFADHPYGHRSTGNLESLATIQLSDLKLLYGQQIKPQGAVLAVSGDITMTELLAQLPAGIKNWQGKPKISLFDLATAKVVAGLTQHVEMPTTQTLAQLTRLGPDRLNENFFSVFVLNHILGGGGFGSELMTEVREKRGLVYGVYSYFIPLASPGPFIITLQTRADQANDALSVVRETMLKMASGKISKKQLKAVKNNLIGGFAQRMDSNRERIGLMAMIGFYGLPLDYLQVWTQRVNAVSLADIKQAATQYLNPAQWNQITVGPKQP